MHIHIDKGEGNTSNRNNHAHDVNSFVREPVDRGSDESLHERYRLELCASSSGYPAAQTRYQGGNDTCNEIEWCSTDEALARANGSESQEHGLESTDDADEGFPGDDTPYWWTEEVLAGRVWFEYGWFERILSSCDLSVDMRDDEHQDDED